VIAVSRSGRISACIVSGVTARKLYRVDMAELVGISIRSLGRANLPPPDGHDMQAGHARPWWKPATARAWKDQRPGKGWRRGRVGAHGQ
jgi:hypothetical protein